MGLTPVLRYILIGIPIGVTFVDTVGYVARVEGVSMQPALNPDVSKTDYVFLNRWTVRNYNIRHGDIISFTSPKYPNQTLIKRVIGLQGDEIGTIGYRLPYLRIPEGHCWVEGDHTGHSVDSNTFGPVSLGLITAKATWIIWPPSRWQSLNPALPENRVPFDNMRAVNFVQRLQWDVPGNIFRHGIAIGDVDNDGDNELVVGTSEGDLYIFKNTEMWHKTTGLGMITCISIGDIFNYGRNALVVICGDGWVHIYYSPRSVNPNSNSIFNSSAINRELENLKAGVNHMDQFNNSTENTDQLSCKMECVHLQRIPTNTKFILIADIDRDGANEMIIGLTDRVVRSYRWSSNADLGTGKLVGLNKWECANQIGTVTLQHMSDGTPTLLVAQPGGTFMRIKCNPDDCTTKNDPDNKNEAGASCVDYQFLGISRMRNPNISTEIIGNLEPGRTKYSVIDQSPPKFVPKDNSTAKKQTSDSVQVDNNQKLKSGSLAFQRNYSQFDMRKISLGKSGVDAGKKSGKDPTDVDQVDGNILGGNIILGSYESNINKESFLPSYENFSHDKKTDQQTDIPVKLDAVDTNSKKQIMDSKPYALATLDGTIMLVKDEIILWAMQVDHLIFALCRLDMTGDGSDEIVACAWDGHTYFLDQERNSIRFQFEEPVRSFCTGKYSLTPGMSTPSLVYVTFTNKIVLYYDVVLPSMVATSMDPFAALNPDQKRFVNQLIGEQEGAERDKKLKQLTEYLLYNFQIDNDDHDDDNKD